MKDALILADVTGIMVLDQVFVELCVVIVPRLAKLASRMT